jgi:hypothetical protein
MRPWSHAVRLAVTSAPLGDTGPVDHLGLHGPMETALYLILLVVLLALLVVSVRRR